ncbi:AAA family ATPase [Candidatus Nitrosotenuis cloacae]|uniref:Chromosome segregation protein SMC n=1 Tax=Candidatus Nitrosotenuis cloacae TaxID=1603555 RepID=A0A3G1B3R7_9ARCH|nr:SMC family ATPase [Candidatus Nitrosotenuis cloacae]AJZ76509.1 chromosome segregation protein SMC [Candidatus Nitrosotenuis cloacae]
MITSIELGNFISHSETKLDFEDGVTVFVGHNGAGKSSIIDAITFGLFGEHTRKSNKSLIRRGTSQAYVKVRFSARNRKYEVTRKIDAKGTLAAQFVEIQGDQELVKAAGERRQFGESTTHEIETTLGLDFQKLKIASIVQQGELNSIIKAKPKEFKELLNAIIGIDKLDLASENLKVAQKNFRQTIYKKFGYDDTHIPLLTVEMQEKRQEIKESEPHLAELQNKKQTKAKEVEALQHQVDTDSAKESILKQIEDRKSEFTKYVRDAIISIQKNITEKERKIRDCQDCFEMANKKDELEYTMHTIKTEIEGTRKKITEHETKKAILNEHAEMAKKLQLQDGKCPVCDSHVDKLNPVFQVEHLKLEQENLKSQIKSLEEKRQQTAKIESEISEQVKKATAAKATLDAHSIQNKDQISALISEVASQKAQIQKIPLTIATSGGLLEASEIDSHAKTLYEKIESLQKDIVGFVPSEFLKTKSQLETTKNELSKIDQEYGAITQKITQASQRIEKINTILVELNHVKEYLTKLDEIQDNIYNRDGPVATSLRSWALSTISGKASDYLAMLNTKIHRITLAEKTRDISITCYSKNTIIDIDSLSGGEQVSVALSLRLGMTHLLGSSNLNFVILDEPTTHLDSERRKSLVRVLSQLSDISNGNAGPLQFIIITHDAEIFEDSSVEKIYQFESSQDGTKVALL